MFWVKKESMVVELIKLLFIGRGVHWLYELRRGY